MGVLYPFYEFFQKDSQMSHNSSRTEKDADDLFPSELGTKTYWESFYAEELRNFRDHGEEGDNWFGSGVMRRTVQYLKNSLSLPLNARVLDLGCGNGAFLREGMSPAGYTQLEGWDYCIDAVELSTSLAK